jgi:hypothetical protein
MQGVLEAGASLTRLQLQRCTLTDDPRFLTAALQQLPQLQHFELYMPRLRSDVRAAYSNAGRKPAFAFPNEVMQHLQGLTFLSLVQLPVQPRGLKGLSLLTNLRDLQVTNCQPILELIPGVRLEWYSITADMLTGMQQLTKLQLHIQNFGQRCLDVKPGMLSTKSHLQHLSLCASLEPLSEWSVSGFLPELQQLTQLTYLELDFVLDPPVPSAAAYAALTASSKLQVLRLGYCKLPPRVWQHLLPPGKQLLQLQELRVGLQPAYEGLHTLPEGGADLDTLVGCCPNLRVLHGLQLDGEPADVLPSLTSLTGLQCLGVWSRKVDSISDAAFEVLAQLTGLTSLSVLYPTKATGAGLLHLTKLWQLQGEDLHVISTGVSPPFNSAQFDKVRACLCVGAAMSVLRT